MPTSPRRRSHLLRIGEEYKAGVFDKLVMQAGIRAVCIDLL